MSLWPRDIDGPIWPRDDLARSTDDDKKERVITSTLRNDTCEACGTIGETGISTKDSKRICATCLHARQRRVT